MLDVVIGLLITGAVIWVIINGVVYAHWGTYGNERRDAARRLLLTPIWPLVVLWWVPGALYNLWVDADVHR